MLGGHSCPPRLGLLLQQRLRSLRKDSITPSFWVTQRCDKSFTLNKDFSRCGNGRLQKSAFPQTFARPVPTHDSSVKLCVLCGGKVYRVCKYTSKSSTCCCVKVCPNPGISDLPDRTMSPTRSLFAGNPLFDKYLFWNTPFILGPFFPFEE